MTEAARTSATGIRVLIVEDDRETRWGLRTLIDGARGCTCVGAYEDAESAVRSLDATRPDVVLLDINLPGMSGTEGVREIKAVCPQASVLMLTVLADHARIFEAVRNGAVGYLLKKTPAVRIVDAIHDVHRGGAPMSPEIARKVVEFVGAAVAPNPDGVRLTDQERRLLGLIASGHSYAAAGDVIGISVNTVRNHVRNIYDKLQVHSKSAAVSKAMKQGLL
jgi:DNA-binding NarL/FixJ family response regulator